MLTKINELLAVRIQSMESGNNIVCSYAVLIGEVVGTSGKYCIGQSLALAASVFEVKLNILLDYYIRLNRYKVVATVNGMFLPQGFMNYIILKTYDGCRQVKGELLRSIYT